MSKKRLILLGGGHTHALLLRSLVAKPFPDIDIILVSPQPRTTYSGMLPGFIAGFYSFDEVHFDLVSLCKASGVSLILDNATGIDVQGRRVNLAAHDALSYDVLSINVGCVPDQKGPGLAVKPMTKFLQSWESLATKPSLAVVGGGPGGVELALSIKKRRGDLTEVSIIQRDRTLLPGLPKGVQRLFAAFCHQQGIRVHLAEADPLSLLPPSEPLIWATSAKGSSLFLHSDLLTDENGFLLTDSTLLCKNQENIFATGDCAVIEGQYRPRAGVFAVRLAKPLRTNLERHLRSQPLVKARLQKTYLSLITTGSRHVVAVKGSFYCQGKWLWFLKDWIDRRFMNKFKNLK